MKTVSQSRKEKERSEAVNPQIVGYIVIPLSQATQSAFFQTLAAAMEQGEWDWISRVWSDGTVTAGDQRDAGVCGMALGGDYTVSRAADWLAEQPACWLRAKGILV